jgi:hypothetical protein
LGLTDNRTLYRVDLTSAVAELVYESEEQQFGTIAVDPQGRIVGSLYPDRGKLVRIDLEAGTGLSEFLCQASMEHYLLVKSGMRSSNMIAK